MCFLLCGTECARGFFPSASERHGVVWPQMLVACAGTVRSTGDRGGRLQVAHSPCPLPTHTLSSEGDSALQAVCPPSLLSMQASLCACPLFPNFLAPYLRIPASPALHVPPPMYFPVRAPPSLPYPFSLSPPPPHNPAQLAACPLLASCAYTAALEVCYIVIYI